MSITYTAAHIWQSLLQDALELHNKGWKLSLLFKNLLSSLCSWKVSLDVTKETCKPAGLTLFSIIPARQTQPSPRPSDIGSFEGTKPSIPAVHLAILLPTQHLSLFAIGMEDLGGDALGLLVSPVREDHWRTCCFPALLHGARVQTTVGNGQSCCSRCWDVRRCKLVSLVSEEQSGNPGLFRNPGRWHKEITYKVLPCWQEGGHRRCQDLGSGIKLIEKH